LRHHLQANQVHLKNYRAERTQTPIMTT